MSDLDDCYNHAVYGYHENSPPLLLKFPEVIVDNKFARLCINIIIYYIYYIFNYEIPGFIQWIKEISSQAVIFTLWKYQTTSVIY